MNTNTHKMADRFKYFVEDFCVTKGVTAKKDDYIQVLEESVRDIDSQENINNPFSPNNEPSNKIVFKDGSVAIVYNPTEKSAVMQIETQPIDLTKLNNRDFLKVVAKELMNNKDFYRDILNIYFQDRSLKEFQDIVNSNSQRMSR